MAVAVAVVINVAKVEEIFVDARETSSTVQKVTTSIVWKQVNRKMIVCLPVPSSTTVTQHKLRHTKIYTPGKERRKARQLLEGNTNCSMDGPIHEFQLARLQNR